MFFTIVCTKGESSFQQVLIKLHQFSYNLQVISLLIVLSTLAPVKHKLPTYKNKCISYEIFDLTLMHLHSWRIHQRDYTCISTAHIFRNEKSIDRATSCDSLSKFIREEHDHSAINTNTKHSLSIHKSQFSYKLGVGQIVLILKYNMTNDYIHISNYLNYHSN